MSRRVALRREFLIFLGFLVLTAVMTWPWVLHLRDAVRDEGDSYAHAYFLWWDYHQTFHDPLHLFDATIFYPYRDSLAFGENDYGIALVLFPLFALGLKPLTAYSVAVFLSFPFTGYGMFRLARTLSKSSAIGLVAAIVVMFLPYRFQQISLLPLVFAGWIPLLFEALVLFARERTWTRAAWLALAFLMNALTCLTWFVLTLLPLAVSAILLINHYRLWRDRDFWKRTGITVAVSAGLLLPFLLPFLRVARLHNFVRRAGEVQVYSAQLINWLAVDDTNRLWHGLGAAGADPGMVLFPGLLPPLLALGAFLLIKPGGPPAGRNRLSWRQVVSIFLDLTALTAGCVAVIAAGYDHFRLHAFGRTILSASDPTRPLLVLAVALLIRCFLNPPQIARTWFNGIRGAIQRLRSSQYFELVSHGVAWATLGFMGSFGQHFVFHRLLFEYVPLFRSMRVAARWAMICYVGLALLAGLGAWRCALLLVRRWPRLRTSAVLLVLVLAILFEQRVAPFPVIRGEVDPDQLTLYLKAKKMAGGIVELPASSSRYMLRAADHEHPLVTATNSFTPPIEQEIEALTGTDPIPDRLLDLLETIPTSYVTVHNSFISPERLLALERLLDRGIAQGRLRFIRSFKDRLRNGLWQRNDLYAVTKTEPDAQSEGQRPPPLSREMLEPLFSGLVANFQQSGFLVYRYYRVTYGRDPRFAEFIADVKAIDYDPGRPTDYFERSKRAFAEGWIGRCEFRDQFDAMNDQDYVAALLHNAGLNDIDGQREQLTAGLRNGTITRVAVLQAVVENNALAVRRFNEAFVLMHYFAYLKRDPDEEGYRFWLHNLNRATEYRSFTEAFAASIERQLTIER